MSWLMLGQIVRLNAQDANRRRRWRDIVLRSRVFRPISQPGALRNNRPTGTACDDFVGPKQQA